KGWQASFLIVVEYFCERRHSSARRRMRIAGALSDTGGAVFEKPAKQVLFSSLLEPSMIVPASGESPYCILLVSPVNWL
ncbi:MAG: hypothetical protein ACM34H_04915, partial [Deltaproteobacteria bacterium]